ncbi:DUF945 family protein [Thioflexithrix psekupsensis]|uniref:DUF945 domain-containing protein n=1 Tax=Thioflexithrix psekupsensis TaxID=1570016 RepID=A0A251X3Y5_9GAMM|nr:DUF945 family protein [Thioflexithrix psekupsensis]OUD12204.1 hypothetical protein TPSD3_13865 [Thioflexithrix psekupsensis]
MKPVLYTTLAGFLTAQLLLPMPIYAQTAPVTEEEEVTQVEEPSVEESSEGTSEESSDESLMTEEASEPDDLKAFSVKHTVKDQPLDAVEVEADPLVLLTRLKQDIQAQVEAHGKPLTILTEIRAVVDAEIEEGLGGLPVLVVKTDIDKEGAGSSVLNVDPWARELPADESSGDISLKWDGLTGKMNYNETFEQPRIEMTFGELKILEKGEQSTFTLDWAKSTLSGQFDVDMFPVQLNLHLPDLTAKVDTVNFLLNELKLDSKTDSIPLKENADGLQVDLSKGTMKVAKIDLQDTGEEAFRLLLEGFELMADGQVDGSTVSYQLSNQISKLLLEGIDEETLEMSYRDQWSLNQVNAAAMARIQKQVREVQQQRQNGHLSEDLMGMVMIGTFMQELPGLWADSPELMVKSLQLKTQQGQLDVNAKASVDGKQPLNLDDTNALMQAITVEVDAALDAALLKKILTLSVISDLPEDAEPSEDEIAQMVDGQIAQFVVAKYLAESDGRYTTKLVLSQGKFLLNGVEMPLPF